VLDWTGLKVSNTMIWTVLRPSIPLSFWKLLLIEGLGRVRLVKLTGRNYVVFAVTDKSLEIRLLENKESLLVEVSSAHKLEIKIK
jgi:hypothetical protein